MIGAGLAVAAGNAEVTRVTFVSSGLVKLNDAEALAYQIDTSAAGQKGGQVVVRDAVDFDVEVLGVEAEEGVAHRPAHHHWYGTRRVAEIADDLLERNW